MIDWSDIFYFSVISALLVLSAMGLWFTAVMPGMDRWSKRFFRIYCIIIMGCFLSSFTAIVLHYFPASRVAVYIMLNLECLLLSLPLPMLTAYLLHCRRRFHRWFHPCQCGKSAFPRTTVPAGDTAVDCNSALKSRGHGATPGAAVPQSLHKLCHRAAADDRLADGAAVRRCATAL